MWNDVRKFSTVLSLIGLLFAIYLLSYTGTPSSDDEQLFASVARNVSVSGKLSAEQLYGNFRLKGNYHGVEPAHPALASLWLRLFQGVGVGSVQLLFLLPIIYTILTCVFMLSLAVRLGYSISTGLIIVLFYSLSTMAWPYTKTFFREPLGGMLALGSWLYYLAARQENGVKKIVYFFLFVIFGAISVFTKVVYSSIWIAFFIMWCFSRREKTDISYSKTVWLLPLIIFMSFSVWLFYSWKFTDADLYYRVSGGFIRDVFVRLFFISHSHFGNAIMASMFSPFKGLFVYSPVLFLSFVTLILKWKNNLQLFVLPLIFLLALLLVQSLAYDSEWWTPTWGSRFLLPAIPLLLIMCLPLIDELFHVFRWGKPVLVVIFVTGFLLQLPAILFNSSLFFVRMYTSRSIEISKIFWDLKKSPILLQWGIFNDPQFDLLISRVFPYQPVAVTLYVFIAILFAIISLRWLYIDVFNPLISARILQIRILFSSSVMILLVCSVLFLGRYDPFYRTQEFKPLCDLLQDKISHEDVVVIYSYPGDLWDYFSNAECGQGVWYSLPYRYYKDVGSQGYQMGVDLFSTIKTSGYSHLWFISQYDTSPLSGFEKSEFEDSHYYLLDDGQVDTPVPVYYFLYELK